MYQVAPEEAIKKAAASGRVRPSVEPEGEGESLIIVKEGHSALTKEELIDKIKGVIYGNCIGDAIGLATEFMTKKSAGEFYKRPLNYQDFARDSHRARWVDGDWTDDSDQMLLILDSIRKHRGTPKADDFAKRLLYWVYHGFPELGDLGGFGLGATTSRVIHDPRFLTEPHVPAKKIWKQSGKTVAPNGGVMRTSILGIPNFHDLARVRENTEQICLTTHADPRCLASCVAVTTAIALLLQGRTYDPKKPESIKEVTKKALAEAKKYVNNRLGKKELKKYTTKVSSLADLELDEKNSIGYTYKALGAGFYCLEHYNDFEAAITDITFEAGDADTNGAVVGGLMGAKLGFKALPERWVTGLANRAFLDERVNSLLELLGLQQ